jgi:hypothetical protein
MEIKQKIEGIIELVQCTMYKNTQQERRPRPGKLLIYTADCSLNFMERDFASSPIMLWIMINN